MRIWKIAAMLVAGALLTACYEDFDTPAPQKIYNDADMGSSTQISIADLKQRFIDAHGSLSNTGNNASWNDTKYVRIEDDVYIKGKVISDDKEGNVYKSLYLWDGTAAIEIKLTNGNYLTYHLDGEYDPVNHTPINTRWCYVKLRGLYLGNYRMMLSVGNVPSSSVNAVGTDKYYANSNIEDQWMIAEHVFPGEETSLTYGSDPSSDILVVNPGNYKTLLQDPAVVEQNFGRLVSFENLTCHYAGVMDQTGKKTKVLKNGNFDQIYPSWIDTSVRPGQDEYGNSPVVSKPWYRWAFSRKGICLYGSVCMTYNPNPVNTSDHGVYSVRTSGYSQFAGRNTVRNGAQGSILGLFAIYSQRSNYKGGSSDYATYQISVSRYSDIRFEQQDYLTDGEADALTPNGIGAVEYDESGAPINPVYDASGNLIGTYHSGSDSYYVPSRDGDVEVD